MSSSNEAPDQAISTAITVLRRFHKQGLANELSLDGGQIKVQGRGCVKTPTGGDHGTLRRTTNSSLLPRSVSSEARRQMLYAIMEDQLDPRLRKGRTSATGQMPLAKLGLKFSPFEKVHRIAIEGTDRREMVFPFHISIPAAFHTYKVKVKHDKEKLQTDKSFRGPFMEFFVSDPEGNRDNELLERLRQLFADVRGLSPIDLALVTALTKAMNQDRHQALKEVTALAAFDEPEILLDQPLEDNPWLRVYVPLKPTEVFKPLHSFVEQGRRLTRDVRAVLSAPGVSRLQRLDLLERCIAYHLSLYMVRLSDELYRQLAWATRALLGKDASSRWDSEQARVRYHAGQYEAHWHEDYDECMGRLNETYLMLPVLNGIEVAVRAVLAPPNESAATSRLCWTEARASLEKADANERAMVRHLVGFFAGLAYEEVGEEDTPLHQLIHDPVESLFLATQHFYSQASKRRYPKNHQQDVFEFAAGDGPTSFLQRRPARHFRLGDELIYMLVLAEFESHGSDTRRVALRDLEERLAADLLLPADDEAHEGLRSSLARLGLIERFSDVGEANFLKNPLPTGVAP